MSSHTTDRAGRRGLATMMTLALLACCAPAAMRSDDDSEPMSGDRQQPMGGAPANGGQAAGGAQASGGRPGGAGGMAGGGQGGSVSAPVDAGAGASGATVPDAGGGDDELPPAPSCTRTLAARPGTLRATLAMAMPGDCVALEAGVYSEAFETVRAGEPGKPIVIKGPKDAIVRGASSGRMVQIKHSHVVLYGFTLAGKTDCDCNCGSIPDTLLYVQSFDPGKGVTGVRVLGMTIEGAKGECVRLKYLARGNEIAWNTIRFCGREDFGRDGTICAFKGTSCEREPTADACKSKSVSKNGEGIYVGTAPEQSYCPPEIGSCKELKNPTKEPDVTRDNHIHHNTIDTRGNECVDVKENATANLVEHNTCTGQGDPNSAGLDARGDGNVFRYNVSRGNVGAGVRLGGDRDRAGTPLWGFQNQVYGNVIENNRSGGIKVEAAPQGRMCGNRMNGNAGGNVVGSQAGRIAKDPTGACD